MHNETMFIDDAAPRRKVRQPITFWQFLAIMFAVLLALACVLEGSQIYQNFLILGH